MNTRYPVNLSITLPLTQASTLAIKNLKSFFESMDHYPHKPLPEGFHPYQDPAQETRSDRMSFETEKNSLSLFGSVDLHTEKDTIGLILTLLTLSETAQAAPEDTTPNTPVLGQGF